MPQQSHFPPLDYSLFPPVNQNGIEVNIEGRGIVGNQFTEGKGQRYLAPNTSAITGREIKPYERFGTRYGLTPENYIPPESFRDVNYGIPINENNAYRYTGETQLHFGNDATGRWEPVNRGLYNGDAMTTGDVLFTPDYESRAFKDFKQTGQIRGKPSGAAGTGVYKGKPFTQTTGFETAGDFARYEISQAGVKGLDPDVINFRLQAAAKVLGGGDGTVVPTAQAYFQPRHPNLNYYTPTYKPFVNTKGQKLMDVSRNTIFEISSDFAPIQTDNAHTRSNPLYWMGNHEGNDARVWNATNGTWSFNTGEGAHITINPKENPSFIDRVNPANRKGIRIYQEQSRAISEHELGVQINNFDTKNPSNPTFELPTKETPNYKIEYDRITPVMERPLSTHLNNIKTEAQIFGNAAKSHQFKGTPAGFGGALASLDLIGVPLQIAGQVMAANGAFGDTELDKNYGLSDPLSLRAAMDVGLDVVAGDFGPQTVRNYEQRVNDPQYIQRNPLSSMVGQGMRGNTDYLKAFWNSQLFVPKFAQFNENKTVYSSPSSNLERVGLYQPSYAGRGFEGK